MVSTKSMTVEEFEQMSSDGRRHELVRGELQEMPATGLDHGRVGTRFLIALWNHVSPRDLGQVFIVDTGFRISPDQQTVRVPDVSFVTAERLDQVEDWEKMGRFAPAELFR